MSIRERNITLRACSGLPESSITYLIKEHQHKAKPFDQALAEFGLTKSAYPNIALYDKDWQNITYGRENKWAKKAYNNGAVIMLYPHCFSPPWWYDGMLPVSDFVDCIFVVGEGQKKATEIFVDKQVEITGWPWCPQKDFQKTSGENILFAPIHPAGQDLRHEAVLANKSVQQELLKLGLNVTCRYIGKLEDQGLEYTDSWAWIESLPDGSYKEIDEADVVIAEGTFMYLSVARGKPTVGINQHIPIRSNIKNRGVIPLNWHLYGNDLAYPLNFGDRDLIDLLDDAQTEQTEWRKEFLGEDMSGFAEKVIDIYNQYQI